MIDLICFSIFIGVLTYTGWKNTIRVKDESSYLFANRRTGLFALTATLVMTEFNPSTLLAFSGPGYFVGIRALYLPLVFLLGLGFYTLIIAKQWKRFNAQSVAELFTERYGKDIGQISSFFLLIAMIGFSGTYVKSLVLIFSPILPSIDELSLSLILIFFVLVITLRGGLVAIISTDIISFIGTIIFIPLIFYFSYDSATVGMESLINTFPTETSKKILPGTFIISLIILTMFTYIAAPWYGQKIFSANSEQTAFIAVGISSVLVFLLYSFPALAVAFLKVQNIKLTDGEKGVPYIITNLVPIGLRGFAFGILFSAGATTLSGVWSAMTTMVVGDFLKENKTDSYLRGFGISLFFAILTLIIANTLIDKILNKLILANIPIAALSFALLGGFYWKRANRAGAIFSIISGFSWGIFTFFYFGESGGYTWYWAIYGIPLIFFTGIIGSLLFPITEIEAIKVKAFFSKMNSSSS